MSSADSSIRLVREIGRGAEGIVYEGFLSGTHCALKRISKRAGRRELLALQTLKHPQIVSLIGFADIEGETLVYIGLELLGKSLASIGKMSEKDAANALKPILHALIHMHSLKWVHFDLKPSNILVTLESPLTFKLSDFGLATRLDNINEKQESSCDIGRGTPHFMSPETASLKKDITTKSDIWSFAACALNVVTGELPIRAAPLVAAFKLAHDAIPIDVNEIVGISETFRELLHCCLNRDPLLRPTAEELLHHAWFHDDEIIISDDIQLFLPDFTTLRSSSRSETSPNFSFNSSSRSHITASGTDESIHSNSVNISLIEVQNDLINVTITLEDLEHRLSHIHLIKEDTIIDSIDDE
jgi:serine/threonine protein kinase